MALTPDPDSHRYDVARSALRLLAAHAELLRQYLTHDGEVRREKTLNRAPLSG